MLKLILAMSFLSLGSYASNSRLFSVCQDCALVSAQAEYFRALNPDDVEYFAKLAYVPIEVRSQNNGQMIASKLTSYDCLRLDKCFDGLSKNLEVLLPNEAHDPLTSPGVRSVKTNFKIAGQSFNNKDCSLHPAADRNGNRGFESGVVLSCMVDLKKNEAIHFRMTFLRP